MTDYAIVENNTIINVATADDPAFAASMGWVELSEGAGIGWTKQNGVWVTPAVVPPTLEQQSAARAAAYRAEADPLFFMSQRGEATVEEWQAKVAEIKARFPYPSE